MKLTKRFLLAILISMGSLTLAGGSPTLAQSTAGSDSGPLVTVQASDSSIEDLARQLSESGRIPVLVDGELEGRFSGSFNSTPLEQVLEFVKKSTGVQWRKLYLPPAQDAGERLKQAREQAAVLEYLENAGAVILFNPDSGVQVQASAAESSPQQVASRAAELKLQPVYLLKGSASAADAAPAFTAPAPEAVVESYATMDYQRDRQFLMMNPQQRVQALEQAMMNEIAMNPTERSEVMRARMEAYRALRSNNSAIYEQYRDMQRDQWRQYRGRDGDRGR